MLARERPGGPPGQRDLHWRTMKRRILVGAAVGTGLAVLAVRRAGLREDLEWAALAKPGELIDIDGYGVHYVDKGSGPAIVLLHGFGGSTYQFRHQIGALSPKYRVVAVDLKGFGYSERSTSAGLGSSDQVEMLVTLFQRLGVEHATLVGHSMGGGIAQRFASAHPEKVDALVLAASVNASEPRRTTPLPRFLLRPLLPVMAAFASSRLLSRSVYDKSVLTPAVRAEYNRPGRLKGSMDGLMEMMSGGAGGEPIDLSAITMPVMLLWGEEDRVVPLSGAARIREQIPQARMVVIDRAGHLLFDERPEVVTQAILSFVNEAVPASGSVALG